jgi:predicted site-specific integrase-resolvase
LKQAEVKAYLSVRQIGGIVMRAALYLRVSTDDQTTDNQERELRAAAARAGHEIVRVYRDGGVSGAKGRDKRPAFDARPRPACPVEAFPSLG